MEIAPIHVAGKFWHRSNEPPQEREKTGTWYTDKRVEREPLRRVSMLKKMPTLEENTDLKQNCYNALCSKNMWNPSACAYLNAADHKGKTCALCC